MTDLILKGTLNLTGRLNLVATGGKVKIEAREVLVEGATGTGVPVILPPPPASPIDDGTDVSIRQSFNKSVTVRVGPTQQPVVALGICLQGRTPTWPGMVLPSVYNSTVRINGVRANVKDDQGVTLPNGGTITFGKSSGQS